jgi:hypothetical protein
LITWITPELIAGRVAPVTPKGGALADVLERDLLDGKISGQLDQVVNIPGVETVFTSPKAVLLAHVLNSHPGERAGSAAPPHRCWNHTDA